METVVLKHTVSKENEGRYYTLPFEVPQAAEQLTVSYRYPEKGASGQKNVIDLGLVDGAGRFLGWSGSARPSVSVGEYSSTHGYLPQPVEKGRWGILIGAYKVSAEGVPVEYTLTFQEQKPRLLFGDLHVHSDASDGQFDIPTLAKRAKKKGLDFIGIANHNNYAENLSLPRVAGLTFIPAVEWTHYQGHMNFLGAAAPFENSFIANSTREMRQVVQNARARGALISVNHPKCNVCPYLWQDEESFDCVEVWNGPMRPVNLRGIAWWTQLLRQGRRVSIVGGSDYHRRLSPVRLANPVTGVWAASPAAGDILAALAQGNGFVTRSVNGPRLSLRYGEAGLGGSAAVQQGEALIVSAQNLGRASLVLVTQNEEISLGHTTQAQVPIAGPGFAYVKAVVRLPGFEAVRAISNPIYFT